MSSLAEGYYNIELYYCWKHILLRIVADMSYVYICKWNSLAKDIYREDEEENLGNEK